MRFVYVLLMSCIMSGGLLAQTFNDDFNDGDFTTPAWTGSSTAFVVNGSNQLQLMDVAAGSSYLSTAAQTSSAATTTWEFFVFLDFSPSGSNQLRVYLTSDNADLSQPLNGYYLEVGETGALDAFELFRSDAGAGTSLLRATDGSMANTTNTARVRVTRTAAGVWTLEADYTGGTTYVNEGSATDATYPTGDFFGFACDYTSTRADKFYFDDVVINPIVVDVTPPNLISATAISGTQVDVVFDEALLAASANTASNYTVTDGGTTIPVSAAALDGVDPTLVHLTLGTTLSSGTTYSLSANNIQDAVGNAMTPAQSTSFSYFLVVAGTPGDVLINEVMADENPQVGLPAAEFIELYNQTGTAIDYTGWTLERTSIPGGTVSTSSAFPAGFIAPGEYVIVTDDSDAALFTGFGSVLSLTSFPSLTNGGASIVLYDAATTSIHDMSYSLATYQDAAKDDGGWTLELRNPAAICLGEGNYIASNDASGGTPGAINSTNDPTFGTAAPTLVSANAASATSVVLTVDKALDPASANVAANYFVSGVTVSAAVYDPATLTITLTVSALTSGTTYTASISAAVTDCLGTSIGTPSSQMFTYFVPVAANQYDILINELYPDPDDMVILPNVLPLAEFVELYNRSSNPIDLGGFEFSDASSSTTLPSYIMAPGEYVILAASGNVAAYSAFGTTLDVGSLPSLNNTSDDLTLLDASGNTIDAVSYTDDWYNDPTREDGGYTLERVNPNLICEGITNWRASLDPSGGTPGAVNSVFDNTPDTQGPNVVSAQAQSNSTVLVEFDDILDIATATNAAAYSISPTVGTVTSVAIDSDTSVLLTLSGLLTDQVAYTVTAASTITDCTGNSVGIASTTFTYFMTLPAERYDLIINEFFPDPTPALGLPEKEFVELYNRSNKPLNLQGYELGDGGSTNAILPFYILLPGEFVIIHDLNDAITYSTFGNEIKVDDMPTLGNTSDLIELLDDMGEVLDAVSYTSAFYQDAAKDDGGWTIERINPDSPCEGITNWRASDNPNGGTPGQVNSVLDNTSDTQGPDLQWVFPTSTTQLELRFSEAVDEMAAGNIAAYTIDNGINVVTASALDPTFTTVLLSLDPSTPLVANTVYTLTIDATFTDCIGNPIGVMNTLQFALPETIDTMDVVINEVLSNPQTGGVDFIELYNRSSKVVNIGDLILANTDEFGVISSTEPVADNYLLLPGEYVVLTEDPADILSRYTCENQAAFLETDLPTYSDKEGTVVIYTAGLLGAFEIDRFTYTEDLHYALIDDLNGVSLERIDPDAPTASAANWHSAASTVGYATPTYQNSQFMLTDANAGATFVLNSPTFSPDQDGFEDVALIQYNIGSPGYTLNLTIYDAKGRQVTQLVKNELLAAEGTLQWDGRTDEGEKARIGPYVILAEYFDLNGNVKREKLSIVVAGQF